MGFRLQSALAGAATSLSNRLRALEEETNELVKTEAGRVNNLLQENTKKRTAAKLDYGRAARKLEGYGLSDGQIEAVLAGGLDGATQFEQSLQSKATRAALEGKQFDKNIAINELVAQTNPEFAARDIQAQEEAYAAMAVPNVLPSLDESVRTVSTGIAGMAKGSAPTDYIRSQLDSRVRAGAGERPEEFTGRAFGTDLGFQFAPELVTPQQLIELQKTQAEVESIEAGTGLTKARTTEIRELYKGKKQLQEAEIRKIDKGLQLVDAQISSIVKDIQVSDANIQNIRARTALTLAQRYTEDQLRDLKEDELKAAIDQTRASIAFTESRTTELDKRNEYIDEQLRAEIDGKLATTSLTVARIATEGINAEQAQQDLNLSYKYGDKEREAKLDLLEAQVYNTNRPTDLEEYQTLILMENDAIRKKIAETDDEAEKTRLTELMKKNDARITNSAKALAGSQSLGDLLNKGAAPTVFSKIMETNLTGLGLDGEYTGLENFVANLTEGQLPLYFKGVSLGLEEFDTIYGMDMQGNNFVRGKRASLNRLIENSDRNLKNRPDMSSLSEQDKERLGGNAISYGAKTPTELKELEKSGEVQNGSVAYIQLGEASKDPQIQKLIDMYGSKFYQVYVNGEWVNAGGL